jgi:hypothetical protein
MDGAQAYGALAFEQGVLRIGSGAVIDNDGIGLYAEGRGSRVELTESLIAGARGDLAPGCAVSSGGVIAIRGSEITDSGAVGVIVGSEGGEVTLLQTIVEHTRGNTARETGGGIVANAGRVSVEESVLRANASIGIVVGPRRGSSASVEVRGSAIHDTAGREGLSSDDQEGFGVWVSRGSTLAMSGTDLRANEFAALGAQDGATVAIDRSVFRDTRKNRLGDFGEGIYSEADLSIADSAILGNTTIGLQLVGERSVARVTRTLIDGTLEKQPGVFGHGVMVLAGGVLELRASEVRGSAGVGVAVDDGSAIVEASLLRGNGVGLHVQGQARLTEVEVVPDRPPVFEVLITRDSRLVENGVRVGVGAIPVPDVVTGPRL